MPRSKKEQPNHAGGLYEVKITVGKTFQGKGIRKSFYSSISKEDARKQAEQFKVEQAVAHRTGITDAMESKNFAKWAKEWLLSVKGTVKDSTYNLTYANSVDNHLTPIFGKLNLSEIKQIHVQNFFNDEAKRFSKETQKKVRMCLSAIFESAINNELIFRNPCHNIKLSGKEPTTKNIYTKDEVALILNFAQAHRYGLEIIMLLTYGLRRGELLGLQWADLDFDNNVIHIRHAVADVQSAETGKMEVVVDDPKTALSTRDLPMTNELETLLKVRPRSIVVGYNEHKKKSGKTIATDFVFYTSWDGCAVRAHGRAGTTMCSWTKCTNTIWRKTRRLMCQSVIHTSYGTRELLCGLTMTKIFSRLPEHSVGETSKCYANNMRIWMQRAYESL